MIAQFGLNLPAVSGPSCGSVGAPTTNADRDSLDSAQTAIEWRTLDDTLLLVAISYRFGCQIELTNVSKTFRNGFSLATTAILVSDARVSSVGSLFKEMLKFCC